MYDLILRIHASGKLVSKMTNKKQITYDVDGYDVVTDALLTLINQYPALDGDAIKFSTLGNESGKAMFPISGAVVESEKENIIGHVTKV